MIFSFLFLASLLSSPSAVLAEEKTTQIEYVLNPEDIQIGDSVQLISKGIPLGRILVLEGATQYPPVDTVFELFPQLMARDEKETKTIVQKIKTASAPSGGVVVTKPAPLAPQEPAQNQSTAVEKRSLAKFIDCLNRWNGVLQKIYSLKVKGAENSSAVEGLNYEIDQDRGDGEKITQNGFICGKYLGDLKLKKQSLEDELKLSLAFTHLKDQESQSRLFRTMIAAFGKDFDFDTQLAWIYLWNALSLKAAFLSEKEALPEPQELTQALTRTFTTRAAGKDGERVSVTVTLSKADWDSVYQKGDEFIDMALSKGAQ